MSDQIKTNLTNKVELIGKLAEFEMEEGTTQATETAPATPYISCKGVVQYGKDNAQSRKFQCFVKSTTSEGKESKLYPAIKKFADQYGGQSAAKVGIDNATEVSLEGSLRPNIYYSDTANDVVDTIATEIKFLNPKKSADIEDGAFVSLEAYIKSIKPEVRNDSETGRLVMELVSATFNGDALVLKNVIVPEELADDFSDLYEMGKTGEFYCQYITTVEKTKKTGGLGVQRSADKVYTELILTGATEPYDEDDEKVFTFSREAIKILLAEKNAKIEQIKNEGGKSISSKGKAKGLPNTKNKPTSIDDDEDMPF